MGGIDMKQFNLAEYLENPDRRIITRDGRSVRIICTDRNWIDTTHIIALVTIENGVELTKSYSTEGRSIFGQDNGPDDLFFAPIKKEGWINLFKVNSTMTIGEVYNTEEEAKAAVVGSLVYISTVKVEWEE